MKKVFIYLLVIISFIFPDYVSAQEVKTCWWIQAGLIKEKGDRIGLLGALSYGKGNNVLTAGYYYATAFTFLGGPTPGNLQKISNFYLRYGYNFRFNYFRLIPSAGISGGAATWNTYLHDQSPSGESSFSIFGPYFRPVQQRFNYIGATANLSVVFAPIEACGFGIDVFANLHRHPDFGIVLSLNLGRL